MSGLPGISVNVPTGSLFVPATSLVLAYDMETLRSGKMRDFSPSGLDGTITGTTDVAGVRGRARTFATNDRVDLAALPTLGLNITIGAWFKWTTNPTPFYAGINAGSFTAELRIQNDGHFATVFYQQAGPDIISGATAPSASNDGLSHYATAVLRAGQAEIWIDGSLVAGPGTAITSLAAPVSTPTIGLDASYFTGTIDEVVIFARALQAWEIALLAGILDSPQVITGHRRIGIALGASRSTRTLRKI